MIDIKKHHIHWFIAALIIIHSYINPIAIGFYLMLLIIISFILTIMGK